VLGTFAMRRAAFRGNAILGNAVLQANKKHSENGYFEELPKRYVARRTQLCNALEAACLPPTTPQGSFFVLADISAFDEELYVDKNAKDDVARDWHFCRWMTKNIGVTAIPMTAFCKDSSRGLYDKYIRFAFCKTEEQIAQAAERLLKLREFAKKQ
jgi:aspartate/methionine/tyrosine aminotransferase